MKSFKTKQPQNVDEYITQFPNNVGEKLTKLRSIITKTAPAAEEVMSYSMPAYKYHGMLVYFAAYEHHIGLYPMPSALLHFKKELVPYVTAKSTIQFPLSKRLPVGLITAIIKFRVRENFEKMNAKKRKTK
jgi:uncharacterized protein YdhG (YjbR/CyaY superfamily)